MWARDGRQLVAVTLVHDAVRFVRPICDVGASRACYRRGVLTCLRCLQTLRVQAVQRASGSRDVAAAADRQRARRARALVADAAVMRWLALVALLGCSSDKPPAPPPAPAPAVKPAPPAAPSWQLYLASDYGPCSTDDPRPCHVHWTATPDGNIVKVASPNDPKKPNVTTTITLSPAERDELVAIVASPEFVDGMAKGFSCQGGGSDPDATLRIGFGSHDQHVELCVRDAKDNAPKRIDRLVRR